MPEELFDQLKGKGVITGRHWCVGSEKGIRTHRFGRLVKGEPLALHQFANALQSQEGAMPFVHVPDRRGIAEGTHRAHTTNPQHNFLADAHLAVATIKACAQLAILRCVACHIGIHQKDRNAPDLNTPNFGIDRTTGQVNMDQHFVALWIEGRADRHLGKVDLFIFGLLATGRINALGKVALGIKEADADKGQVEVARLFAMITAEDTQATAVDRQRFMQAKLSAKIGDDLAALVPMRFTKPAQGGGGQIFIKGRQHRLVITQIGTITSHSIQPLLVYITQEFDRIVIGCGPELTINPCIERLGIRFPTPPEVVGKFL